MLKKKNASNRLGGRRKKTRHADRVRELSRMTYAEWVDYMAKAIPSVAEILTTKGIIRYENNNNVAVSARLHSRNNELDQYD